MEDAHIKICTVLRVFQRRTDYLADFVALAGVPVTHVLELLRKDALGFFDQRIYQVQNDHNDPFTSPHWISTRMSIEHVKCTYAGCGLLNCLGLTKPW